MSRENFFNILDISPSVNDNAIIVKAIKKKQAEWSKLRNHPSKGRIAQKNLSLLKDIKKIMLNENLRVKEAQDLLKETQKDQKNIENDLNKQIELLSSKGKIYKSELDKLKNKFPSFNNIEQKIKVKIIADSSQNKSVTTAKSLHSKKFLPTLEISTLKKIQSSLNILNKKDLYHFLGVNQSLSIPELKKVTEKKYLQNNKSASKTAEVTSTSELLGMIKSIISDTKRKELYDNSIILQKLKTLDELIEISGKNGVVEKEEYLFIYEEGKLNGLDNEIIKKYISFFANNNNIKIELPDFSKPIKFRNKSSNEEQLFELIRSNEPRDIEDLLNSNLDINKKNKHGSTPLILATYSGHLKIVKILLDNGADVNLASNDKTTPLIWATVGNHTAIVRYLLNNNAKINAKDKHGFTALMWAASKSNESLVKIFLQYNADTQIKNNNQETAYELAKKAGNIRLFYIIKDHNGGSKANLKEDVFKALNNNDLIFLSKQYGVNFNEIIDDNNNNILHLAIQKGKRDIIEWILSNNKVDINSQNTIGNTPLIEAILKNDDVSVSNILKEKSLMVNKQDNNGYTALIHAVNTGNIYIVKTLLQHNAKMEVEDNNGNRALTIAVWQSKRELVSLLIDNGAKTDIKNKSGKTLLDLAKQKKNKDIIDYLSMYITPGSGEVLTHQSSSDVLTHQNKSEVPTHQNKGNVPTHQNKSEVLTQQTSGDEPTRPDKKEEKKPWWKFW